MNVQRDMLELKFQVRPSTFFQRCRDQQWYINQLLKKQWHHENEIKQLKDRLRREVSKNKHSSTNSATTVTSGASITEINPVVSTSSSAISVGKNCQLISVNLASTASTSSTSYSSSSASETADQPSYSGAKSKHSGGETKHSSKKSNAKSSKDKSSSSSSRYDHFYNEFDVADRPVYTNQLADKRTKDNSIPSDGK